MLDILIRNIKVIDGTGSSFFQADVGIKDGKISAIGNIAEQAVTFIDGHNLYLSPGFIDTHGHEDCYIFSDSSVQIKLSQGITTSISGNCGITLAPVSEKYINCISKIIGEIGFVPFLSELTTFSQYMKKVDELELGINMGFYLGHGTLRMAVMGLDDREPSADEMERMKEYLREALDSGAIGMSTGLIYPSGCFSKTDELIELASVLKEKGGVYATHIRNEGDYLFEAIEEAIEIGRKTGVAVIISHHKAIGSNNWGKVGKTLKMIEDANNNGIEVGFDVYPYNANSTGLKSILPPSCFSLGVDMLLNKLKDPAYRENIKSIIFNDLEKFDNYVVNCNFDRIMITMASATPDAVGKTIAAYAEETGKEPFEAAFDMLVENNLDVMSVFFSLSEDDVEKVIKSPFAMIGTDGLPIPGNRTITHPRLKGTFPRVLGRYVREKRVLSLEDAIRKMTSLPASRMGLKSKGLISEGFDADLVIFDAYSIIDNADYINCYAENIGIQYVIVNGKVAFQNNKYTGAGSGKLLRM